MSGRAQEELEKELAMEYQVLTYADYENGLKDGKLLGLHCSSCRKITCNPMPVCQWCGSRMLERTELSGEGVLETFTVIRVASEGFEDDAPFIPCLVRTREGPCVIGRLAYDTEQATQDLIGKQVKLTGAYTYKGDRYSGGERICPIFSVLE
ncbi:MAG: OB-fold domain-containing protein [Methanomicrobia archaeon]|nr:OB-fold domain-containing protein [Methanomicrobia archaeon]